METLLGKPATDGNGEDTPHSGLAEAAHVAGTFFRSLAYSAVQQPLDGVTQLLDAPGDALFHHDIVPRVSFIKPPEEAKFGSAEWAARLAGGGIGTIVPFYLGGKLATKAVEGAAARWQFADAAASKLGILESGSTAQLAFKGAVYEGIFHPVDESQGNVGIQRMINASAGALSFGVLGWTRKNLRSVPEARQLMTSKAFAVPLVTGTAVDAISGVGSGLVDVVTKDALHGRLASPQELAESAAEYAVLGGSLHLTKVPFENAKSEIIAKTGRAKAPSSCGESVPSTEDPVPQRVPQTDKPTTPASQPESTDIRDYTSMGQAGKVIGFDPNNGDSFVYMPRENTLPSESFTLTEEEFSRARFRTVDVDGKTFAIDREGRAYSVERNADGFSMRETNELIVKHLDDAQVPWPPIPLDNRAAGRRVYSLSEILGRLFSRHH
jgi:hypothetical protein